MRFLVELVDEGSSSGGSHGERGGGRRDGGGHGETGGEVMDGRSSGVVGGERRGTGLERRAGCG